MSMIINLIFAALLTTLMIAAIVSLDVTTSLVSRFIKKILQWTRRSQLLTSYILKAYVHYRRSIHKPLINKI